MSMLKTSRIVTTCVVGLLVLGLGAAFAQSASVSDSSGPVTAPVRESTDTVTPQQMRTQTQSFLAQMVQSAQAVKAQLAKSREARDVVKVLCLNDKLTQIDVAIGATRDRISVLNSALDHDDLDNARHEFVVLQVLRDRVRAMLQESNQCIGEEAGFVGESKVTVQVEDSLPGLDPTQVPQDSTSVIIEIPIPASRIH
jgi:hypothetical protein